jgi:hypothetical protein
MLVRLQDFKCFADTGSIEIKPITLLIGENSTGKTSFMAGLRLLLEWANGAEPNPFNRSPYFLGGFDQISFASSGQKRKKESFTLSLSGKLSALQRIRGASTQRNLFDTSHRSSFNQDETFVHKLSFGKGASQPDLQNYTFSIGQQEANFDFRSEWVKWRVSDHERDLHFVNDASKDLGPNSDRDPSSYFRQSGRYLRFLTMASRRQLLNRREKQQDDASLSRDYLVNFEEKLGKAWPFISQRVFASPPVRSEPKRTYNPSEVVATSDGSPLPLELALAWARTRSPDGGRKFRETLSEFGRAAGLFEDIDVRQLGKKDGDPFQVLVKLGGLMVNLMDVGYGVSQALPIIYQVQNISHYDAFLLQQPEVHLHPKAQAELGSLIGKLVNAKTKRPYYIIETHSDYLTNRVCIEVQRKNIDPGNVKILYFSRVGRQVKIFPIDVDSRGQLLGAPPNFKAFFLEEQRKFLGL